MTGKEFLPEKDLLEKAATMKRFEYPPLESELKKQIYIAEKQYKRLSNTYEFDRIKKEKSKIKKCNRSNLMYDSKYDFYEYYNIKHFENLSLASKYPILASFYKNFNSLKPEKESTKGKKANVYDNASEPYNEFLEIHFD